MVLSPAFFVANTSSSSGPVPSSTSLSRIVSCCFLTSLYLVSTKLNAASSVFSSGFTEKIVSNSNENIFQRSSWLNLEFSHHKEWNTLYFDVPLM